MRNNKWRNIAIASLVVLGLYIVGSVIYDKFETLEAQGTAQEMAEPVDDLCTNDMQAREQIGEEKCEKAAEVQAETNVPDVPLVIEGDEGPSGRGIRGTRIDGSSLIVSYTDGTEQNVGTVVGESGDRGAAGPGGPTGRGIASTEITEGQLQINYTDGSTELLGTVVGADGENGIDGSPGRGIANTEARDGRLYITYTDDPTPIDIGPLPAGPEGPRGEPGIQGPAGPPCPDGYEEQDREVTSNTIPPIQETWRVCVKIPLPEGEEPE